MGSTAKWQHSVAGNVESGTYGFHCGLRSPTPSLFGIPGRITNEKRPSDRSYRSAWAEPRRDVELARRASTPLGEPSGNRSPDRTWIPTAKSLRTRNATAAKYARVIATFTCALAPTPVTVLRFDANPTPPVHRHFPRTNSLSF